MNPLQGWRASWAERRQERAERGRELLEQKAAAAKSSADFEARHRLRLEKAISVSSMEMACHRDTWEAIEKIVFPVTGYRIPYYGIVGQQRFPQNRITRSGTDERSTVKLSGPHLVRCLTVFRAVLAVGTNHFTSDPEVYALSRRMYDLLGARVDAVDMNSSEGALPVLIVDASLEETPEA
ncbi:hypothetical protein [Streptomyces sp. NPDC088847]|uniref:hypothetical protein n=1 Tax=Streptomyces sp. NPDC088847 TaxID=3365909 RepID=UPI0037F9378A